MADIDISMSVTADISEAVKAIDAFRSMGGDVEPPCGPVAAGSPDEPRGPLNGLRRALVGYYAVRDVLDQRSGGAA